MKTKRLIQILGYLSLGLIGFFALLVFVKVSFIYYLYGLFLAWVVSIFGLDMIFSRMAAALLTVLTLLLLPWVLSFLLFGRRRLMAFLAVSILIVFGTFTVYFAAGDILFDRATGAPVKYYLKTLEGFKFSSSPDFDPRLGAKYKPVTPEISREYLAWERTGKQKVPQVEEGRYFDILTGEPIVWYAERAGGGIELFSLPGHDPFAGRPLKPMTAEKAEELKAKKEKQRQEKEQEKARLAAELKELKEQEAQLKQEEQRLVLLKAEEEKKEQKRLQDEEQKKRSEAELKIKEEREKLVALTAERERLEKELSSKGTDFEALKKEVERKQNEARAIKEEMARQETEKKKIQFDTNLYLSQPSVLRIYGCRSLDASDVFDKKKNNKKPRRYSSSGGGAGSPAEGEDDKYTGRNMGQVCMEKLYFDARFTIVVIKIEGYYTYPHTMRLLSIKLVDDIGKEYEMVGVYNISTNKYNEALLYLDKGDEKKLALIFDRLPAGRDAARLILRFYWCQTSTGLCQNISEVLESFESKIRR